MTSATLPAPRPIGEIAAAIGLRTDQFEPYGWFQAKLALGIERPLPQQPVAKYVVVTAINPTPWGEGKTVVAIGLSMALNAVGSRAIVTLRQPSLGPVLGVKGGGAGGGRATLLPADQLNLHFTGDMHAVTAATNTLAALIDNHVGRQLEPRIQLDSLRWPRAIDICDRSLERITTGLAFDDLARQRAAMFVLTPASEIMAILSLARDLPDLRRRLGRIVIGRRLADDPRGARLVTAEELRAAGVLAALLRDAFRPNLVQTCEQTPALVHTGPFANIAHGNSSVIADRVALRLADFVVTESGFGSECGAEKLFDIKSRATDLHPDAAVLVCTVRALKYQSGQFEVRPGAAMPAALMQEDTQALTLGLPHLRAHLRILRRFGVPAVVAVNRFPSDTGSELEMVMQYARSHGASDVVMVDAFAQGSAGAIDLANAIRVAVRQPNTFQPLYSLEMPLTAKVETIATELYGADGVDWTPVARQQVEQLAADGFSELPVCIAKTQYSLSHDPKRLGCPSGFRLPVREVRVAAGAGYVYALCGDIRTMPGLPSAPRAQNIDLDEDGQIVGLSS